MAFNGSLLTNKVFASLFNQIISIQVFGTGVEVGDALYESRKVDGTLYGDTKLYISTDALKSYAWSHDGNPGYNLLTLKRPPAPVEESISMGIYRQIPVSIDDYLTKQAFKDEGTFAQFNGVILAWLGKTKEVYEHTTYTSQLLIAGRDKATKLSTIDITVPAGMDEYDTYKFKAQEMFRQLEDSVKELKEPSRDYNDNGFLRTAKLTDFDLVIPLGVLSNVDKHDVPFLFNEDTKPTIKEVHWKYFGTALATAGTSDGKVRALVEKDFTKTGEDPVHLFPGDLIPNGFAYGANEAYTPKYESRPTLEDGVEILLIHKDDFPIMSAFSVGTSFFNAQNLVTNHYLTFGHNDVMGAHIGEFPLLYLDLDITVETEE